MIVVGWLIVGSPSDTRESVEANLEFARKYVDWPYIQHPTPYPGTPMTKDFRDRGLIINERLEEYDGTTAVVRTEQNISWQTRRSSCGGGRSAGRSCATCRPRSPAAHSFYCGTRRRCSRTPSAEARSAHSSGLKTSARPSSASRPSGAPSAPTCNGRFLAGFG
jgi:hypothetical protein